MDNELSHYKDRALSELKSSINELIETGEDVLLLLRSINSNYEHGEVYQAFELAMNKAKRRGWL